jgi:TPP-dependent pyruvate/acetoin dehydrogenase alpha subunit
MPKPGLKPLGDAGIGNEDLLAMYGFMLQTREFEDAIQRLYQQGKIVGGAYSGRGNEATSVGSAYALGKDDYIFPLHRDLGAHLVRGQSIGKLMLQYLGRTGGFSRGRDGTGHYVDPKKRIYGNISHLGAMVPVAVGVALASRLRKQKSVCMTYIGDGGANVGEVHEGLAMASVMRLPFVLIIENNQYAYSTPISKQFLARHLSDRAAGYGIPGRSVDGTDIVSVYRACREAVERARKGEGASIIECVTMRMQGHAAHDTAWYVPKSLLAEWKKKDPVERLEKLLVSKGLLSEQKKNSMAAGVKERIEEALRKGLEAPYPQPADAAPDVYATEESGP